MHKKGVFIQDLRIRTFQFVFRVFLNLLFAKLRIDNRHETAAAAKNPRILLISSPHSDKETIEGRRLR
jgi:hypothetical protein